MTKDKLREVNGKTLAKILDNHKHWINEDCVDWRYMQADISGADLRKADLHEANLREADLHEANLRDVDLRGADLSYADLRGADLRKADLRGADLRGADIRDVDLSYTDLSYADLSYADLRGADLSHADLNDTDISGAKYDESTIFLAMQCPEEGSYIAWKKAGAYIIKLRITDDAKRSSATSRKCRASKAEVLEIQCINGRKADIDFVRSNHNANFVYRVGAIVEVNDFDSDRWNECTTGIHHFITRQEAVNY